MERGYGRKVSHTMWKFTTSPSPSHSSAGFLSKLRAHGSRHSRDEALRSEFLIHWPNFSRARK